MPLIITGPSGAGKGTLINKLFQCFPDVFELSISLTTRPKRVGETHGLEYFFVEKDKFLKEVEKNKFLEFCHVHENYYGTHKDEM